MSVDRYELRIPPSASLECLDPLDRPGGAISPGADRLHDWILRPSILRNPRSAFCAVAAYVADTMLAVCTATIEIPGIDGLRCALASPDSVRFIRDSLRYQPNPVPVVLDLSNVLDLEETAIEAEIDLTNAPRFELAAGETILKTLARLDSHSTATLSWWIVPLSGSTDEAQDIRIRYKSTEQGDWKECNKSVVIEAWPAIAESRCATGGHDSLHADHEYERIIPEPFQVSYTATNSGTVTLTNCAAAIVPPTGFMLAGSDSIQSCGSLDPGQSAIRWWTLKTSPNLSAFGSYVIDWIWTSEQQDSTTGCPRTIHVVPDPSIGIVLTPFHMYFEGELGYSPPPAQTITLWSGGGLAMPWTAQSDAWYIDVDPVAGDHAASIAVQPSTTMLPKGTHRSTIEVAGVAPNLPKRIEVEYRLWSLVGTTPAPRPSVFDLGPVYPHPIAMDGEAKIMIEVPEGTTVRLLLYDLLGRERAVLHEGPMAGDEVLIPKPSSLGLVPGIYLMRLIGNEHESARLISVVR